MHWSCGSTTMLRVIFPCHGWKGAFQLEKKKKLRRTFYLWGIGVCANGCRHTENYSDAKLQSNHYRYIYDGLDKHDIGNYSEPHWLILSPPGQYSAINHWSDGRHWMWNVAPAFAERLWWHNMKQCGHRDGWWKGNQSKSHIELDAPIKTTRFTAWTLGLIFWHCSIYIVLLEHE